MGLKHLAVLYNRGGVRALEYLSGSKLALRYFWLQPHYYQRILALHTQLPKTRIDLQIFEVTQTRTCEIFGDTNLDYLPRFRSRNNFFSMHNFTKCLTRRIKSAGREFFSKCNIPHVSYLLIILLLVIIGQRVPTNNDKNIS